MRTTRRFFGPALVALAALASASCDNAGQSTPAPAQFSNETFQDFGAYELHFNALRTDTLPPDIARAYAIQRATNRVMLNVTILHKEADQAPRKPVDGQVTVDAYNLNGQLKNLEMRRVSEGDAIYYIGEVPISGTEILVFDISVVPTGQSTPLKVKFKREFHAG